MNPSSSQTGARLLVKNLEAQGVEHIFAIPGAKVDRVFDALLDSPIKTHVCRHEQNAAFIAQGFGRITGQAGVCLVTSGPGCSNLTTGLATATSEGDPVVAIGGSVSLADRLKQTHQTMDTVSLFRPVTKFSAEIDSAQAVSEVLANAFRTAESGRPGAAFVSVPKDIMEGAAPGKVLTPVGPPSPGGGDPTALAKAARILNGARSPVILLGLMASHPQNAAAVGEFLRAVRLPVMITYQAAGTVPRENLPLFCGRVGLFHNQPADRILDAADAVLLIGYDAVEYDPCLWNAGKSRPLIHLDVLPCDIDNAYQPTVEITGNIALSLRALSPLLQAKPGAEALTLLTEITRELSAIRARGVSLSGAPVHPLRLVHELQELVTDDMTVISDVGSHYIWMSRYFQSFGPRRFLASDGQQTLGVALPWAIAASLCRPREKVISMSGDGGFLFSAMELETAVRLKCNFVHLVWRDGSYNMVRIQQLAKYGRDAAVEFGTVDTVQFAQAFGAMGLAIRSAEDIGPVLKKALDTAGPVLIDVPVDYRENAALVAQMHPDVIH
ncbi:MAG: acetolactate synthase AlsS [Verrucomicrobiae bacterium]|nr:acetolactate synthase AlsS [Verrucomicrobiae bacterium]